MKQSIVGPADALPAMFRAETRLKEFQKQLQAQYLGFSNLVGTMCPKNKDFVEDLHAMNVQILNGVCKQLQTCRHELSAILSELGL